MSSRTKDEEVRIPEVIYDNKTHKKYQRGSFLGKVIATWGRPQGNVNNYIIYWLAVGKYSDRLCDINARDEILYHLSIRRVTMQISFSQMLIPNWFLNQLQLVFKL